MLRKFLKKSYPILLSILNKTITFILSFHRQGSCRFLSSKGAKGVRVCVCVRGGGGKRGVLIAFHAIIFEKFTVTCTFTRHEFKRENFKPCFTSPRLSVKFTRRVWILGLITLRVKTLCHPRKCSLKSSIFCFCFVLRIGPNGAIVRCITLR